MSNIPTIDSEQLSSPQSSPISTTDSLLPSQIKYLENYSKPSSIVDVDDIFINTQFFGIYHPKNFHSFYATWKILPVHCLSCSKKISVTSAACICLRCGEYAHRNCVASCPPCSMFTFFNSSSSAHSSKTSGNSTPFITSPKHKTSTPSISVEYLFSYQLDSIVEKACILPTLLQEFPLPKSKFCIWKSIYRAILIKNSYKYLFLNYLVNEKEFFIENLKDENEEIFYSDSSELTSKILKYFENPSYLPCQVSLVSLMVFLSLKFPSINDMILHLKECIEVIRNSFFYSTNNSLYEKIFTNNSTHFFDNLYKKIYLVIERFVLNYESNIIYDKLYMQIKSFQSLFKKKENIKLENEYSNKRDISLVFSPPKIKFLDSISLSIKNSCSPYEKLNGFIKLMQGLSLDVIESPNDLNQSENDMNIDENQFQISESNSIVYETDELLELLTSLLSNQIDEGLIDWLTECLFLSSDFLSPLSIDFLGSHGYALVTLQQCLSNIYDVNQETEWWNLNDLEREFNLKHSHTI